MGKMGRKNRGSLVILVVIIFNRTQMFKKIPKSK